MKRVKIMKKLELHVLHALHGKKKGFTIIHQQSSDAISVPIIFLKIWNCFSKDQ